MTEIPASRILNALLKKGFKQSETHHTMLWLVVEGRKTSIRTRISHGQTKAGKWLLAQIAKQLHLSKAELLRFIECALSGQDYVVLMEERGHILL
jgi:hypothetical protein